MSTGQLVSVIVPTFNRAKVLPRALESAFGQTHHGIEVIVVDDGSTDGTLEWLDRVDETRLRVLSTPENGGPARARNLGLAACRGDYVAFLDSDDVWEPWKLQAQLARFDQGGPRIGAVYCGRRIRLPDGTELEIRPEARGDLYRALLRRNSIPLPTLVVRRAVLDEVGAFDPTLPACEDWDLILRIARVTDIDAVASPDVQYDGTGADRMSARARSVFSANHRILRRYSGHDPSRSVLATHLALQSRELLHMGHPGTAARYAFQSALLSLDWEERIAVRTLRSIVAQEVLGRLQRLGGQAGGR